MLGMTTLLPWNFFIAVNDYWNYKFRDVEHNTTNHTVLQKEFTSYLGTKYYNLGKPSKKPKSELVNLMNFEENFCTVF